MGLFRKLGKEVEQFKRTATEAAAEDGAYRCEACEAEFAAEYDQCPECGAETVVPTTVEE
ncbi:hypothetical protein HUG10_13250 [Halorarum halophilum]|uniref:Uncharacterized protein n=1 Tax=Halorarum halophilum TaxID=2743090 RepID=A0A7D5KML3_9EURY|nr:hypothetical protein [Halobaculum halophilum]QLG28455.1 hypothetical protein HUG10_13250 [Halobaculum halophilum]